MRRTGASRKSTDQAANGNPPPVNISSHSVQTQLEKILASPIFIHADTLSRFLTFIVNQAPRGEGERLKEYRIAVDVFGRGEDFDPKEDTIVRVQARNLRSNLRAYYQSASHSDSIVIDLPTGTYVPT